MTVIWQLRLYKRYLFINAFSLVLFFCISHTSYAQEPIVLPISGFIENQSSNANESDNLDIVLNVFKLGENIDTLITNTNIDGSFNFDEVPGGVGFGYIIQIQTLGLVELENSGSLTFIPNMAEASKMEFLRFSLPEDVIDLDVQSSLRGGQILQVGLGFAITTPIPPGKHELAYTFTSPYTNGNFSFQQSLPIGANSFKILIPRNIGLVTADGLTTMQDITLGDKEYNGKEISNLLAGTKVDVLFYNLPQPSLLQKIQKGLKSGSLSKWLAPTAMATILALFFLSVVYQLRRSKNGFPTELQSKNQEDLLDSIAHLEEQLSRGAISHDQYIETRRQFLEQLSSHESSQEKGSL